jgi:hypothetical protein
VDGRQIAIAGFLRLLKLPALFKQSDSSFTTCRPIQSWKDLEALAFEILGKFSVDDIRWEGIQSEVFEKGSFSFKCVVSADIVTLAV